MDTTDNGATNHELFYAWFTTANDALLIVNDDGLCQEANQAACQLTNRAIHHLLAYPIDDILLSGQVQEPKPTIGQPMTPRHDWLAHIQTLPPQHYDQADGTVAWVEIQVMPHLYPHHHLVTLRNITTHHQLEQKLRLAEQQLDNMAKNPIVAMGLIRMDDRGHWQYEYQSERCETLLGYSAAEIMATPTLWMSRIAQDDIENVIPSVLERLRQGDAVTVEYRFFHKDNHLRWLSQTLTPQRTSEDDGWLIATTTSDITDRKQLELALYTSKYKLNRALDSANVVISSFRLYPNRTLSYDYISPGSQAILGYSAEALKTNPDLWMSRILPEDRKAVITPALQSLLASHAVTIEYRFQHQDGTWHWLNNALNSFWDEMTHSWRVIGVETDITDRKAFEEAMQQQVQREQALNRVIQAMRHSLELDTIFSTATSEIGQLLSIDQVAVARYFTAQQRWAYVADYRSQDNIPAIFGVEILDMGSHVATQLRQGSIIRVDNASHQDQAYYAGTHQIPGAWLLIPLVVGDQVWGALVLHQWHRSWYWQDPDVDLASTVASHLAIAIQQASLYTQLQVELGERKRAEAILQSLVKSTATVTGEDFFPALVKSIASALDMAFVLVSELKGDTLHTLAFCAYNQLQPKITYKLVGTPCERSVAEGHYSCASAVRELFPDDLDLIAMNGEAYIGVALQDASGTVLGNLCILNTQPIKNLDHVKGILTIFAARAAVELERQQAEAIISQILQGTATATGDDFFPILVENVASSLGVACAIVTEVKGNRLHTLAFWFAGKLYPNANFELPDAVCCYQAMQQGMYCVIQDLQLRHHGNATIEMLGAESYLGVAMTDKNGTVLGTICIFDTKPLMRVDRATSLLRIFTARATAELERHNATLALEILNNDLEATIEERTIELQQALTHDAILKRITDEVRDSLDETKILQTAVRELARSLGIMACSTALYSADGETSTIFHDFPGNLASVQGRTISMTDFSDQYHVLATGQPVQFSFLPSIPNPVYPALTPCTILACPLMDNESALGDLWLFKAADRSFDETDVQLVEQVATQCAIALRQSRLYQAAQTQVKELEHLNQLKDDFLSTVSHELRAPMANIKMATQMLEIVLKPLGVLDDRASRYLKILRDECKRETDLINDLLDLSRLEMGQADLTITSVDLAEWIPSLVAPFRERTQEQQQHLVMSISSDLPPVSTDMAYLGRVITELLHNACKYTPAHESIHITAHLTDHPTKDPMTAEQPTGQDVDSLHPATLQIRVTNTGVEIPKPQSDRIFDKFYRIPNNDPWKHGGTGLGLALVKKLIECLGGTIALQSSPGCTAFVITLSTEF